MSGLKNALSQAQVRKHQSETSVTPAQAQEGDALKKAPSKRRKQLDYV